MTTNKSHKKEEIITGRFDTHVKEIIHILSRVENLSMSDIITKSILEYHRRHFPNKSFLDTENGLFGKYSSGKGDLSVKRKHYLKEMLSGKLKSN
jgi:hypothetical protein